MSRPVWNTTSGFLLTVTEQVFVSTALQATGTAVVFSLLNGQLPSGLNLSNTGTISGTPTTVLSLTSSTFTVRAANESGITDRQFRIDVDGPDPTVWSTSNVFLEVGPAQEPFVYYNQYIQTQLTATSETGTVTYSIVSGDIPKNLSLDSTGSIQGYIKEVTNNRSTFTFVVSATDTISYSTASFSIEIRPIDYDQLLPLQILNGGDLGSYKSNATHVIDLPIYDPRSYLGTTTYTVTSGSLPQNLVLNTTTGVISGYIPTQLEVSSTSTFAVTINKSYKTSSTQLTQTLSITVLGPILETLSWEQTGLLGTLYANETSYLSVRAISTANTAISKYELESGSLPNNLTLEKDGTISGVVSVNTSFTNLETTYNFTVNGYNQNNKIIANADFSIITIQTTSTDYTKIFCRPLMTIDKRQQLTEFLNNKDVFIPEWIYRPLDQNFGIVKNLDLVIDYGIEKKHLTVYHALLHDAFYKRRFQFGSFDYALAKINNQTIYEVIYINILDGSGDDFSQKMTVRSRNNQGIAQNLYIDPENIQLNDPENYTNTVNSMRTVLRSNLKYNDRANPQYLKTIQPGDFTELGYIAHIPIGYTLPGKAQYMLNKIRNSGIDFKQFDLELDRFYVDQTIQI